MIAHRIAKSARLLGVLASAAGLAACATTPEPAAPAARAQTSVSDRAAAVAVDQVGVPYRYGGNAPSSGFDCSGLVHYSYWRAGKAVPRTTGALWDRARPVSTASVQRGDVLFFRFDGKMSHVGLYLGNGQFVHAPSSGRVVSVENLDSELYRRAFIRAGRL